MSTWRQLLPFWLSDLLSKLFSLNRQLGHVYRMPNPTGPYRILVASYTDAVATIEFTPPLAEVNASLKVISRLVVGHHPSWIARHPTDGSLVFTGLEQSDGRLLAIKYDSGGTEGRVVAETSSCGKDPCTIAASNDTLLVGNYSSGTVGVYKLPVASSTNVELKELQPALQFYGTGPNESRQECSHPHQVYPYGDEVLVPDLGADKTRRLARRSDGKWQEVGQIGYEGLEGGGPRHIGVYDNILYTALELTCKISAHTLPPSTSSPPKLIASSSTLVTPPPNVHDIPMLTAELLITPPSTTFPKALVYVSNRNDPHPEGDTIAVFSTISSLSEPKLTLLSETRTHLRHLRSIVFFGQDDRYLIAGGANGGGVKVFERTGDGSTLREVAALGEKESNLSPTGFLVL